METKPSSRTTWILSLGALGVVFGDIGTSPLYALRECLAPGRGANLGPGAVTGIVSLLIWTLIVVVCVKYLALVLRADNRGEGGILALVSLLARPWALVVGILGAALLYADGALTPAVSVLSALEGLTLVSPDLQPWIVPLALVVLVGLFAFQSRGTGRVSTFFGPVIVLWFLMIGLLGLGGIVQEPAILEALNPVRAVMFALSQPVVTFALLGYVFLAVTGTEALYADLGHFGKQAIRRAWYLAAFPALILNYLGQGAVVLQDPARTENLFFQLAPAWLLVPVVILSTLATVIASQAVITGAFSLARQSIQLGLWPRMTVRHTSHETMGQVFVPAVNALLFVGTAALVLGFRQSAALADAYGIAVSGTMLLTTVLLAAVARTRWKSPWAVLIPVSAGFLALDSVFFAANATKLFTGGWVVLITATVLAFLMVTWKRGRQILRQKAETRFLPVSEFAASLAGSEAPPESIPRMAVFLSANPEVVPPSLLHNLKHNQVLHAPTVLLHVSTAEVPFVAPEDRATLTRPGPGLIQIRLRYGFSESPQVPEALASLPDWGFVAGRTSYFLGKETLVVTRTKGTMAPWRKRVFAFLVHNATEATAYYGLPPGQVVELGGRTEI